ncbi:MAG TPA: response regulator transcription factor [Acidimicrobiales bacterium]|nr:response regulator transcription factor [Acidimicrobiales bacterium]
MSNPRVLVVDGERSVQRELETAFTMEGYDVRSVPDGSSLSDVTTAFQPDVAIVEVHQRTGPDGYAMARMLRSQGDLPVVLVSADRHPDGCLAGFAAGADDHVTKPFATAELVARTKAVLRRARRLRPPVLEVGDLRIDAGSHSVTRAGSPVELTRIEYDLLAVLASHEGNVLSKRQLLGMVWRYEESAPNVVEVHLSALRRKLEALGPRMIHTVRGFGYVLAAGTPAKGGARRAS